MTCNICLKKIEIQKCTDCTFVGCNNCIINWFKTSNKFNCPQCKKEQSYEIDYDSIEIREEVEEEEVQLQYQDYSLLLQEGKQFTPEDFMEEIWNPLPQNIKNEWEYFPINMLIEGNIEAVAYKVHKKSNGPVQTDGVIVTDSNMDPEIFSIMEKDELSDEDIQKLKEMGVLMGF